MESSFRLLAIFVGQRMPDHSVAAGRQGRRQFRVHVITIGIVKHRLRLDSVAYVVDHLKHRKTARATKLLREVHVHARRRLRHDGAVGGVGAFIASMTKSGPGAKDERR
jgi:hypothetical protein